MNSISFVWIGCLFGTGEEGLVSISVAQQTWHKVEEHPPSILFLWCDTETMKLIILSGENMHSPSKMFNPVSTTAGINFLFINYNKRLSCNKENK